MGGEEGGSVGGREGGWGGAMEGGGRVGGWGGGRGMGGWVGGGEVEGTLVCCGVHLYCVSTQLTLPVMFFYCTKVDPRKSLLVQMKLPHQPANP